MRRARGDLGSLFHRMLGLRRLAHAGHGRRQRRSQRRGRRRAPAATRRARRGRRARRERRARAGTTGAAPAAVAARRGRPAGAGGGAGTTGSAGTTGGAGPRRRGRRRRRLGRRRHRRRRRPIPARRRCSATTSRATPPAQAPSGNWTRQVSSGSTAAVDTTQFRSGTKSVKFVAAAGSGSKTAYIRLASRDGQDDLPRHAQRPLRPDDVPPRIRAHAPASTGRSSRAAASSPGRPTTRSTATAVSTRS